MEYLRIEADDKERWNRVWDLYEKSFPVAERRKINDHLRACADERFFPLSIWEGQQLIGLMFFWEWDTYRYLEHLAVNPEIRGHGYGSQLLRYLCDSEHTIILKLIHSMTNCRLEDCSFMNVQVTPSPHLDLYIYRIE